MQPLLRSLAPAPPGGPPESSGNEPRRRKKKARLACNHCRLKRVGCDGARPDCTRCLRSRVPCVYLSDDADATPTMALKGEIESLQRQLQEYTDVLANIRNAPDNEVLAIVHRLRLTEDLSSVLSPHQGQIGSSGQVFEHVSARAVMPSTETSIEFELSTLHPTTYPLLVPPSPSTIAAASVLGGPTHTTSSSKTPISPSEPFTYCDPRLAILSVSYWTRIPIDDGLAARTISHFLETDHPVLGFFDADLFLRDLVGQGLKYCSSFLFHSVMSLACQSYSAVELRVNSFVAIFMEEAIKLWHAERLTDSTTTLAALNCLSVATSWNGRNHLGTHELINDARTMATRMQLFDVPPTDTSINFQDMDENDMRDQAHVAWGSYGRQSFIASFFPKPSIRYPPNFSIPGDEFDILTTFDTFEPAHRAPDYVGQTFIAMCKFWTIAQEILTVYNMVDDTPVVDRVIPSFAEAKYQKLLALADTLPASLSINSNSAPHVYIFHALYLTTILNLFRPFLDLKIIRLRSFTSADSTSRTVFSASFAQLKRLVYTHRTYLPRHLAVSCIFNVAILHLSSTLVHQTATDPSWKFFFRLCFDYWKDAYACYRVFAGIVPAHLSLALQARAITVQEARLLYQEILAVGQHHRVADEVLTNSFVDFQKAIRNERGARMDELAGKFEELMLFEDFTQEFSDLNE